MTRQAIRRRPRARSDDATALPGAASAQHAARHRRWISDATDAADRAEVRRRLVAVIAAAATADGVCNLSIGEMAYQARCDRPAVCWELHLLKLEGIVVRTRLPNGCASTAIMQAPRD